MLGLFQNGSSEDEQDFLSVELKPANVGMFIQNNIKKIQQSIIKDSQLFNYIFELS